VASPSRRCTGCRNVIQAFGSLDHNRLLVRLLVENEAGKIPAEQAQVFLTEYQSEDGVVERLRIPLQWTHAPADTNLVTLHAGYPRFVDLVAIDAENDGDVTRMILQLNPPPAGDVTDLVVPTLGTRRGGFSSSSSWRRARSLAPTPCG
jgi:hypothetical protein